MSQDVQQQQLETIHAWLKLSLLPGFGLASAQKLLQQTSVTPALLKSQADLQELGFSQEQQFFLLQGVPRILDKLLQWQSAHPSHHLIGFDSPLYPPLLKEIATPPLLLFAKGNPALLNQTQLAMVGSRNPSHSGKSLARSFAKALCDSGWSVTSGMALGIDACAHQGALAVNGDTIAVLGCGVDQVYPKRHVELYQAIGEQGCLVSEFLPGTQAKGEHFPRRNRIVSGLSKGVLVVEAAVKSGSLITARYALEQGREIFAIPGSPLNPVAAGCHLLIKQGAKLTATIEDINEEFQNLSFDKVLGAEKNLQKSDKQNLASDKLLDSVDYEVTAIDVVAERSGLPVSTVSVKLLEYELRGLVAAVPGGYVKLGDN